MGSRVPCMTWIFRRSGFFSLVCLHKNVNIRLIASLSNDNIMLKINEENVKLDNQSLISENQSCFVSRLIKFEQLIDLIKK